VVREAIRSLNEGVRLDEIAVFNSGDRAYRGLLARAFEVAGVPAAIMPGTPLNELAVGRGVLALARLPLEDFSREAVFEFLGLAPLKRWVPAEQGDVSLRVGQWRRIAREAGVTHGSERWEDALKLFEEECQEALAPESDVSEGRRHLAESDLQGARDLRSVVGHLAARMEPLRTLQPAGEFIPAFLSLLNDYLDPEAEGLTEVRAEVEQLGTIDAISGEFDLSSFVEALEANLAAASLRRVPFSEGVLVADYRLAAGLSFRRVFICGAYEGAFPATTATEPLVQDEAWSALRATHPHVDDLEHRLQLAREAAARLLAVAPGGSLTWGCPLQAANATRDYYPSPLMVEAARRRDPAIRSASDLRHASVREWLIRPPSPLATILAGPVVDRWEARMREAILSRRTNAALPDQHPLLAPVTLLRSRRSNRFTEYDGNLSALAERTALPLGATLSPTTLEAYGSCGFRYFLSSVLRLRGVAEPEEGETIGAAERGTLVHRALERFFRHERERDRPAPGERWTSADLEALLVIFEQEYERLRRLGRGGLDVYAEFDRRGLRADLAAFLEHDGDFREATRAVPAEFELRLVPTPVGDILLTGFVDRLDLSPDRRSAWVIDYKTGSSRDYEKTPADDPFAGGTHLQLPVYVLAAAGAEQVEALYWFVSRRGEFKQISYDDSPANRERFEATLRAISAGLGAGSFPAVPGDEDDFYGGFTNCRYCDFDRLCSRRRTYELQAKWEDGSLLPWRRVAGTARGEVQA
jgi:RecB family exonuclease